MTDAERTTTEERRSRKGCVLGLLVLLLLGAGVVGVLVLLFIFGVASSLQGGTPATVASGSVLELSLSGAMTEAPPAVDLGGLFGLELPPSLWDVRRALERARDDDRIGGLLLDIHSPLFGWATAEELLQVIDDFRSSGKPVHALLQTDMVDDLSYFLATGADRITVNPNTAAAINGLVSENLFLRGSLEKLHIEPQVIMYKEYKSAGEMFGNYRMSDYMRESIAALLHTITGRFRERVVERRGVDAAALEGLEATGVGSAADLQAAGLVDELGYLDQVRDELSPDYHGVAIDAYLRNLGRAQASGDRIAVVFGEGEIVSEPIDAPFPFLGTALFSGPTVAEHLRRAAEDRRVRAILFRVNSPGGSAVGSDLVRREIDRAKAAGKPVVVSMSDLAGSGGYWVAMDADAIVAHPTSLTGSIGVVFTKFNLDGFWQWLGAGVDRVSSSENADILGDGPWQEGDRERVERWMDATYGNFTEAVAKGRGLDLDRVREIARGRVWSGADGLERGLVDELGGWSEAIARVRALAHLGADVPMVVYPRQRTLWQELMDDGFSTETVGVALRQRLASWLVQQSRPRVEARMPVGAVR